jgi:adenylate kinase family enzyme
MGPPGSGKSTIMEAMTLHGYVPLDMSAFIKYRLRSDPEFHRQADEAMSRGELLPDDMVNDVLEKDCIGALPSDNDFVLVGHPRTAEQMLFLHGLIHENYQITMILLNVEDRTCLRRIENRRKNDLKETDRCRHDDDPDIATGRLITFRTHIIEIIEMCENRWLNIHRISGERSSEAVQLSVIRLVCPENVPRAFSRK